MFEEASYTCESCGEEIVVPVDEDSRLGREAQYVEDCPVCCCPHLLIVRFEDDRTVHIEARRE